MFVQSGLWLLLIPLMSMLLIGCSANEFIAFQRISEGGLPQPGTAVIATDSEWSALWDQLRGVGGRPAVDWETDLVLGVFLGERPTGGYSVSVREIRRLAPDRIELHVTIREPSPSDFVTMAFTYPGELIRIEHSGLRKPLDIVVRDQNGTIVFD